jgi:hypothetical protein
MEAAKLQCNSGNVSKRGKSLNRTGLVVVDENEDMTDIDHCYFLNQKKKPQVKQNERYQDS